MSSAEIERAQAAVLDWASQSEPGKAAALSIATLEARLRELGIATAAREAPTGAQVVWPPGAVPGGTYVVQRPESVLNDRRLTIQLPDNFTIKLAPDVDRVDWTVGRLEFGVGCTIDVSAPQLKPPAPAEQPMRGGQPGYFEPGQQGLPGTAGAPGRSGIPLALDANSVGATGSLWIRADGGPGGDGGKGGRGQLGGGTRCQGTGFRKGPPGGSGGTGGDGGRGGATSDVRIVSRSLPVGFEVRPVACASACGPAARPPNADGNDGRIVIWGGPGCGGAPGAGGDPGPGDRSKDPRWCIKWPWTNYAVSGGDDGPPGQPGAPGAMGACGDAAILGPPA